MEDNYVFLGKGWAFPPRFDFEKHTPIMVSEEEDIRESLRIIFSTSKGERWMHPKFGCDLNTLVFDTVDSTLVNRIKDTVSTAVLNFEPRITLNLVQVDTSHAYEGRVDIHLEYTIRRINVRNNIVYPFYLREGTNIRNMQN